jgi:hypothetical protein
MLQVQRFTFNQLAEHTYVIYDETKDCIIVDPGCSTVEEGQKQLHSGAGASGYSTHQHPLSRRPYRRQCLCQTDLCYPLSHSPRRSIHVTIIPWLCATIWYSLL